MSAQRGPGLASRQRTPDRNVKRILARRSTRAGTRVPATDEGALARRRTRCTLNEGRDSRPGNGAPLRELEEDLFSSRSTRAGTRVPATGLGIGGQPLAVVVRSTRAGTRVPATGRLGVCLLAQRLGRSTRAGTRVPATAHLGPSGVWQVTCAQRGPGLASRQRRQQLPAALDALERRSTRAGTRVPATAFVGARDTGGRVLAQRGPGLASRQRGAEHARLLGADPRRSTRAGTRVPATATPSLSSPATAPSLNEGRDSRPGNGRRARCRRRRTRRTLNEGRDSRPGNGRGDSGAADDRDTLERSTRAGTRVPATAARRRRSPRAGSPLNEGRDSRPGNGLLVLCHPSEAHGCAQRGPGLASRQRVAASRSMIVIIALNEGRDSRPGNGRRRRHDRARRATLNEGRDSRPGNGITAFPRRPRGPPPLNEGRDSRPGNGWRPRPR